MEHLQDTNFIPVMTIAGFDNSGGAGIAADLKTFMAFSCYGLSAVAAITAQNNVSFSTYEPVSSSLLYEQIKMSVRQSTPLSTKTGMLATPENIEAVCNAIKEFNLKNIFVDPVLKSSTGSKLISENYLITLKNKLIPLAFAVTPNKIEAEHLSGIKIESYEDVQKSAKIIFEMGSQNVIIKGGHMDFDQNESIDMLYNGKTFVNFSNKKLASASFHGTGCTFSAALCSCLARDFNIENAIKYSKRYTLQTMVEQLTNTPKSILNHNVQINATELSTP
ncbi:MAG: bifunctional hydroxymethylpyrimidine kinase/phosphomethylpyrimidine kinase [Spirochaetia bacterium]|nr:bifunctional hydroxymethylpyrimidine kinase/phosphomethylpyrimidine kinase [Spirochaetia bacterium]